MLHHFVTHHVHDDLGHTTRLTVPRALKDDVFHLSAAQVLNALFA
jgi:hypothetical protein